MTEHNLQEQAKREAGTGTDLWQVIVSPIVWALHFLFCYVSAAIYCEKLGRDTELNDVRWAVIGGTAVALVLIGLSTYRIWRVRGRSLTDNDFEYEHNTPEERHRFLSHVALMLSVLSAVAVIYVAIPMLYLSTCR